MVEAEEIKFWFIKFHETFARIDYNKSIGILNMDKEKIIKVLKDKKDNYRATCKFTKKLVI